MGRRPRNFQSETVYHVISRFVAQEWFVETDEVRRAYLCLLGLNLAGSDWRCFSFAVMSNHIHLALLAGTESLASWLRPTHTAFAKWINERRSRIGAVFVRGPNVVTVQAAGVSRLIGYIHANPVRAGVVASPRASDWTSHRAYLGLAHKPTWLHVGLGLELAGLRSGEALDTWMTAAPVERAALDQVCVRQAVGRPRKVAGSAVAGRANRSSDGADTTEGATPLEQEAGFLRSGRHLPAHVAYSASDRVPA